METRPREILEYVTDGGRCPFGDWLRNLRDVRMRALLRQRINRVRLGNLGDCKAVGDGVKELRANAGPGYRIYFGEDGDAVVVLLCGGEKHTQEADIRRAKRYWADYRSSIHGQA